MTECPNCTYQNRDGARFCAHCRTALLPAVIGGDLRVFSAIDSGGMVRIYKAEHQGKLVAVKEMRGTFTDAQTPQDAINQFISEALTLARLRHPSIPSIHRHFVENGHHYLVMDWIEGQDLATFMTERANTPVPEDQVLDWALQLCDVLEYLHSQNPPIVFRDLKPEHIIIGSSGGLTLVGFGLAELIIPGQPSTPIGTVGYAAPEQYKGLAEPRSDIYALGVTLYYLLTGRDPHQCEPFIFPSIRSINPSVSHEAERIVYKAMEYRLDDRWVSTSEIRERILGVLRAVRLQLGIGEMLTERYQITEVDWQKWSAPGLSGMYKAFMAHDLSIDTECGILPLGKDPLVDMIVQPLVELHHPSLPRMEIISQGNQPFFVCEMATGVPLGRGTTQDVAGLTSIGLQLCSLFQTTGSTGVGFSWQGLTPRHILIGEDHHVWIDAWSYCSSRISYERMGPPKGAIPLNQFGRSFSVPSGSDELGRRELAEISIVGQALLVGAIGGKHASFDDRLPIRELLDQICDITPSLVTVVVGTASHSYGRFPWIHSLQSLASCLKSPPPPVKAEISDSHVDFGTIDWGETKSRSVRLTSLTDGLLCGEIIDVTTGLSIGDLRFTGLHPCHWDIEITWDAAQLETCGKTQRQFTVLTPLETFQVTVQADVRPRMGRS